MKKTILAFREIKVKINENNIIKYKDWISDNCITKFKCPGILFNNGIAQIFYINKSEPYNTFGSSRILCDTYFNVEIYCNDCVGKYYVNELQDDASKYVLD